MMVHQDKSGMMRCPHLPPEIVLHMAQSITAQEDLWACSLVSRSWYTALVGRLYAPPHLDDLLRSISKLQNLTFLSFRPFGVPAPNKPSPRWPPNLKSIEINACRLSHEIAFVLSNLPASLSKLYISDLTDVPADLLKSVLPSLSQHLEYLKLNALTTVAFLSDLGELSKSSLKNLHHLHIIDFGVASADPYVGPFDPFLRPTLFPTVLEHLWKAISNGFLPKLRKVVVTGSSIFRKIYEDSEDMIALNDLLEDLARKDGENAVLSDDESGVYLDIKPDWH
ncbi:MAG: hypothetical protein Q9214_002971 [Letrouitia sp. 1 TL-2023]